MELLLGLNLSKAFASLSVGINAAPCEAKSLGKLISSVAGYITDERTTKAAVLQFLFKIVKFNLLLYTAVYVTSQIFNYIVNKLSKV